MFVLSSSRGGKAKDNTMSCPTISGSIVILEQIGEDEVQVL